jgi:hypothetical protein
LPGLAIGFRDGRLSVEAEAIRWDRLLRELRQRTGVFVRVSTPPEGVATASFRDLSVEQGFRRLFGDDTNFVFLYRKDAPVAPGAIAAPADVWVLGRATARPVAPVAAATTVATASSAQAPSAGAKPASVDPHGAPAPSARTDTVDPRQALAREFERDPRAAMEAAIGSRDPETRLQGIAALGHVDSVESVHTLLKIGALDASGDARISQEAVGTLRQLVDASPDGRRILNEAVGNAGPPEMDDVARGVLRGDAAPPRSGGAEAPEGAEPRS